MMKNKKADLLVGNIVFLILNLLFLSTLILFVANQGEGVILLEETYAKQKVFDNMPKR